MCGPRVRVRVDSGIYTSVCVRDHVLCAHVRTRRGQCGPPIFVPNQCMNLLWGTRTRRRRRRRCRRQDKIATRNSNRLAILHKSKSSLRVRSDSTYFVCVCARERLLIVKRLTTCPPPPSSPHFAIYESVARAQPHVVRTPPVRVPDGRFANTQTTCLLAR